MASPFKKKTLLVTGGTGSFGHAVVKRLLNTDIKEIRVLSRDEQKQDDMRKEFNDPKLKFYIGDVRDLRAIMPAFKNVDFVFNAAALKQVPSCEFYPMEAVKTNVIGSDNVITACLENHVKKAVFLSTDKAAYPVSAMGISKALMEKNVIARSKQMGKDDPVLCLTRFGNIMGTRASVIPYFLERISQGKPLVLTDPEMTRFMMTMEEAVDLVLYAFEHGEQGDLFVKKGPSATLETLAKALLELAKSDVGVTYLGVRHGEKLSETLVTAEEMPRALDEGAFFRIVPDGRELNYERNATAEKKEEMKRVGYTSENARHLSVGEMKELLLHAGLLQ